MSGALATVRDRALRSWNAFWFARGNTFALGLFRIVFAYCLWRAIDTTSSRSLFAIEGGFHLPYVSFIEPVSRQVYIWLHLVQYPLVLFLGVGLFSRFAAGGLVALQGYIFFADQLNFSDYPYFFMLVLMILVFSPCEDALSLKRWLRRRPLQARPAREYLGSWKPLTAQRLIQLQLSITYFYAALHKMNGSYLSGGILSNLLAEDLFDGLSGRVLLVFLSPDRVNWLEQVTLRTELFIVPAILTVAIGLFLAFGLWFRRLRPLAFVLGFGLHLVIGLVMDLMTFSIAALGIYLLFLPAATLPEWLALKFGDRPTAAPELRADAGPGT